MTRVASRAAAAVVALVAGVISYGHIRQVALAAGESELAASLLPIGIDGLIIVATLAMLEDSRAGRTPRLSARFALGFGVLATVAFNVGSAEASWSARAVAAVPAVSFLLAVEVLARVGKPRRGAPPAPSPDPVPARPERAAAPATGPPEGVPADRRSPATPPAGPDRSADGGRAAAGAAPAGGRRSASTGRSSTDRAGAGNRGRPTAAERVAEAVARTPDASVAELARRLGLAERTVQRHRAAALARQHEPVPATVNHAEVRATTAAES